MSEVRTLTLITPGLGKPAREELERLEQSDLSPRRSFYDRYLNSDMLDEYFLAQVPPVRKALYKTIPVHVAQVAEAFVIRGNYDAIVSWAEHLGLSYAALLKATRSRTPHIGIFYWISLPKKARVLRRVHSHFDRIFLMSSFQHDYALNRLGIPPEKAVLLPFHVDQKFWRPMPGENDVISTSGREWRDYPTLIRAVKDLDIPCHIAAKLVSGKKDAWAQEIEEMGPLPSHITFGANESITDVRRWYARSRFIVVPVRPSDAAVGTTVILEAMAMGKAVICSKIRGHRSEAIQDGTTGIFVPPEDPRALREAIQYLWNHPEIAQQMGREGRKRVEQYHTLERWAGTIKDTVEEIRDVRHRARMNRRTPELQHRIRPEEAKRSQY